MKRCRPSASSFTGLVFRVDTLAELQAIAEKKHYVIAPAPITRIWPNGYALRAFSRPQPADDVAQGSAELGTGSEDLPMHPSGQPPSSWPNITRPDGIASD